MKEYDIGLNADLEIIYRDENGRVSTQHPAPRGRTDLRPPSLPPAGSSVVLVPTSSGGFSYRDVNTGQTWDDPPDGSTPLPWHTRTHTQSSPQSSAQAEVRQLQLRKMELREHTGLPPGRPPPLPKGMWLGTITSNRCGWMAVPRDESGEHLLVHSESGGVRDAPWVCLRADDMTPFFANLITGETRWLPPFNWMGGWRKRIYIPCGGVHSKGNLPWIHGADIVGWNWMPPNGAGALCSERTLSYLGTMMRQRVEGGAPYRYELWQGVPRYKLDRYDSEGTYPEWTQALADESLKPRVEQGGSSI